MSTSSCKRPRADSAAGVAEEINSYPSTSAEIIHCSYDECRKPPHWRSGSEGKFCSAMHRNLFMSRRASSWPFAVGPERQTSSWAAAAGGHQEVETTAKGSAPKCMLPTCRERARRGPSTGEHFDFCGKKHMLEMVEKLTKAWTQEGRICGLEECCRHVYAKEDGKCHDYCGMEHATLAAARRGATMVTEAAATALLNPKPMEKKRSADKVDTDHNVDDNVYIENDRQRDPKGTKWNLDSLVNSETGYNEKVSDYELQRLLTRDRDEASCTTVQHGINIYEFHPWELVTKFEGRRPRYFVHFVTQQRHKKGHCQKPRKTKEGFSWKQSSKKHLSQNGALETRYFKYMLEKPDQYDLLPHVQAYAKFNPGVHPTDKSGKIGKKKGPKCRWKMHEIMLQQSSTEFKTESRKVIWMLFQEAHGEPVWPPCNRPDLSEIVPAPEPLPDFVTREEDEHLIDNLLAYTVTPARAELTYMTNNSVNTVLDPLQRTDSPLMLPDAIFGSTNPEYTTQKAYEDTSKRMIEDFEAYLEYLSTCNTSDDGLAQSHQGD